MSTQLLRWHATGGVLREPSEDLVVGRGQSGVQEQVAVQANVELITWVQTRQAWSSRGLSQFGSAVMSPCS